MDTINKKVKSSMKNLAGWDKSGKTYTPPMEVDRRMIKRSPVTERKKMELKKPMEVKKPKVSKSAEKVRVKAANLKNLRDQLVKEQMQTNPDYKEAVTNIRKNNPKISNESLARNADAQTSYRRNLRDIEEYNKRQNAAFEARNKKIKELNTK